MRAGRFGALGKIGSKKVQFKKNLLKNTVLLSLLTIPLSTYANDSGIVTVAINSSESGHMVQSDQDVTNTLIDSSLDNATKQEKYFQRGVFMANTRRYAEAISDYTEALNIALTSAAFLNRGTVYKLSGNPDAAIQDLTNAVRLSPNEWRAYSSRADVYAGQKKDVLAVADYSKVIEIKPDNMGAYKARGIALMHLHKYDAAIDDFTESIRLMPGSEWLYEFRGDTFAALNQDESALMDYATALRIHPDFVFVYGSRPQILEREGRFVEAIQDITDYIRLVPNDVNAYSQRADDLGVLGNDEAARKDYAAADRINPDSPRLLYGRGGFEFDRGEFNTSISDFGHFLQMDEGKKEGAPKNFDTYAAIWRYLAASRINADARSMLLTDVRRLDKKEWPYSIISYYLGDLSESQLWATVRRTDPQTRLNQTCETHTYLGEIKIVRGEASQAKADFERALKECPISFTEKSLSRHELGRLSESK